MLLVSEDHRHSQTLPTTLPPPSGKTLICFTAFYTKPNPFYFIAHPKTFAAAHQHQSLFQRHPIARNRVLLRLLWPTDAEFVLFHDLQDFLHEEGDLADVLFFVLSNLDDHICGSFITSILRGVSFLFSDKCTLVMSKCSTTVFA